MISARVAPFFRCSIATTCAVLLPSRGAGASCVLSAGLALGTFLATVALLVALDFAGAPLADCAPPLAFLSAFSFAGFVAALAVTARLWTRSQMRLAAELLLLNRFTGSTP